ncbi:MAG: FHA domain-containing protein [Myxococcales bacterium]|nr:FHA domain-containing protein [Myxococcales bacterium]
MDGAELSDPNANSLEPADSDEAPAGEDLYDEGEYPPDEEPYPEEPSAPGVKPSSHTETRVAPVGPEEEEEGEGEDDTRAGPPIKVKIVAGPDAGKTKRFTGVRMVVGRISGCDLTLKDQSVSRRHLEFIRGEKGVLLRDLGSGNGTRVNGERVTERLLQHEDEISIGKTKFRFLDEMAAYRKLREAEEKAHEDAEAKAMAEEAEAAAAEAKPEEAGPAAPEAAPAVKKGGAAAEPEGGAAEPEEDPRRTQTPIGVPAVPLRRRQGSIWSKLDSRQRLYLAGGGAASALLIVVLAMLLVGRKAGPPPPDPAELQAQEKLQLARNAVREDRFEDAVRLLDEAEKLKPGADKEGLLKRATAEMASQKALELARALISQGRFEEARAELGRMAPAAVKREDEKARLLLELAQKEAEAKAKQAEEALASQDLEAAKRLTAELPREQKEAMQLKLEQAEAEAKKLARAEAARAAQQREVQRQRRESEREAQMEAALATVSRKLHAAEYERAAAECDRVMDAYGDDPEIRAKAKLLKQLIPSFGRNFEEGHRKFKSNQLAAAVRPLRKARELYQQFGFHGALEQQIAEELAAAALWAGKEALSRDDLAGAAVNFRDAQRLDPGDPRAREGLTKVEAKADDLYTSAYMIRDRDPREAIAKFKLVMEITPPGSRLYDKARNQLAALEPP